MSADAGAPPLTLLQQDLLRAAFVADDTAVVAWRRWRDATDWDAHLDHDTFRLLPRTYRNLCRDGVADPLLPRLKGIARQAWYANQRRLKQFHPTLRALAAAGVELLIVPPTAVLVHDTTAVLAPHAPLACAVRGAQAEAAIRCFSRIDWRIGVRLPRWSLAGYVMAADHLAWQGADGQKLDLLWQWDRSDRSGRFPAEVWERAGHARLANEPVLLLDAADAVYDLCRQPVVGNAFTRMVDLLLCLSAAKASPDWRRFLARAAVSPLDPAWRGLFSDLVTLLPAVVPASVITDWPTPAPQPLSAPPPAMGTMRERITAHWATYRQAWGDDYSFAKGLRHLPGYLLARWHLPAPGRIPLRLCRGLHYEWRDAHRIR